MLLFQLEEEKKTLGQRKYFILIAFFCQCSGRALPMCGCTYWKSKSEAVLTHFTDYRQLVQVSLTELTETSVLWKSPVRMGKLLLKMVPLFFLFCVPALHKCTANATCRLIDSALSLKLTLQIIISNIYTENTFSNLFLSSVFLSALWDRIHSLFIFTTLSLLQ